MRKELISTLKNSWVDWVQLLLIGLLSPLFLFPSMKFVWIFIIIPLAWFCRWLLRKNFFERSAIDWAVFILSIQIFATCLIVPDLAFSLPKIAGALFGIAFFYSATALLKAEKLILVGIISFLVGGFMLSIIGILGMIRSNEKYLDKLFKILMLIPKVNFNLPGAEEGFHFNAVGGTLIIIIPLYLALIFLLFKHMKREHLSYKNTLSLILLLLSSFITIGMLILTQSRGSWIGLLSCLILLISVQKEKKWGVLLIFLFIVIFLVFLGFNKIQLSTKQAKGSIVGRMYMWNLAIETISEHPVFGIGMNYIRKNPQVGYVLAHVHNHLLHTAAELGIPGLIAYLAILIGAGFMCFEIWRKSKVVWMRMSALGLGCGQLAHFIFGMADSIPLGAKVGIFFWFSLALIAAMYNYMLKSNEDSKLKQKVHSSRRK
jgi:putative inorganic carbon (HCO3(-)) transporter